MVKTQKMHDPAVVSFKSIHMTDGHVING